MKDFQPCQTCPNYATCAKDGKSCERSSVPAAGSVLPRCPACGRKPKLYVSMTCNQPDWWHASIRCPLPCHAVRDAGDERRETAIKEARRAWSSYAQNAPTVPTAD